MSALTTLTDEACDELTIEHMLIGVTNTAINESTTLNKAAEASKATGAKKKRDSKKARKETEKEAAALSKTASEAVMAETPLRLNFALFVAQERRDAVLAFAERKFSVPRGCKDEN